ncbi:MAG: peptide chain release factor N(5)-glutamine methyltransferase [Anaerolineales bacterium]|nr:peptide chain release factor N(5)-glutamine methyltransferase [Anaerolineales bacterium]
MKAEELLSKLKPKFKEDSTERDAQIILAHILGRPRTWLLAHLDTHLSPPQIAATQQAFDEYQRGTPLPYIIGHWEFFSLDFDITKDVLIPRPETELLVEKAIAWLKASPERRTIADIGTGSGAIAISIAVNIPDAHILATDISPAALEVARRNANKLNVQKQIEFIECDLFPTQSQIVNQVSIRRKDQERDYSTTDGKSKIDLICANLPYIPTKTLHQLPIYEIEPTLALDGGIDGLDLYRRLFKLIPDFIAPDGMILLEIESTLGAQTLSLARDSFPQAAIHLHQDLTGRDRLLEIIFQ